MRKEMLQFHNSLKLNILRFFEHFEICGWTSVRTLMCHDSQPGQPSQKWRSLLCWNGGMQMNQIQHSGWQIRSTRGSVQSWIQPVTCWPQCNGKMLLTGVFHSSVCTFSQGWQLCCSLAFGLQFSGIVWTWTLTWFLNRIKVGIGVIDGILQDHSEGSEFPPAFHNLVAYGVWLHCDKH
jgi:hypothetical protein